MENLGVLCKMKIAKCILHYSDGLNKNLKLTKKEFDLTFDVWFDEICSGELVYLKIRVYEDSKK